MKSNETTAAVLEEEFEAGAVASPQTSCATPGCPGGSRDSVAGEKTARETVQPASAAEVYEYIGSELELFSQAVHWKAYLAQQIQPLIGRRVVEVGAGIGGTTRALWQSHVEHWLALEPDPRLAHQFAAAQRERTLSERCKLVVGTTADVLEKGMFDTVLYIDVLEHIEHDREEVCRAAELLAPGGRLIVLAPAHQWLFSPFDRAVGHYRRYTKQSLVALTPPGLMVKRVAYLDSLGLAASLANRLVLRQSIPTQRQIAFWDRVLVRGSRWTDVILGRSLGKSVLAVWQKTAGGGAA